MGWVELTPEKNRLIRRGLLASWPVGRLVSGLSACQLQSLNEEVTSRDGASLGSYAMADANVWTCTLLWNRKLRLKFQAQSQA